MSSVVLNVFKSKLRCFSVSRDCRRIVRSGAESVLLMSASYKRLYRRTFFYIKRAYTFRSVDFVTRECRVINIPVFKVNRDFSCSLNCIGVEQRSGFVSHCTQLFNILNRSDFVVDKGNYLFLPGGTGFDKLDDEGNSLWRYEDIAPITAFSNSSDGCIVGFADGKLVTFKNDGTIDYSIYPAGSNYQVILGVDISEENGLTACVCGIDRQRFILFKNTDGQNKIIYHEYLENNLREQTFVKFSKDSNKVFINDYNGLGIIDCKTLMSKHIPIEGKIIALEEQPENDMFFVLTKEDNLYSVYIFENPSSKVGSFDFEATNAFIIADGSDLFIGTDSTISKFEVTK